MREAERACLQDAHRPNGAKSPAMKTVYNRVRLADYQKLNTLQCLTISPLTYICSALSSSCIHRVFYKQLVVMEFQPRSYYGKIIE